MSIIASLPLAHRLNECRYDHSIALGLANHIYDMSWSGHSAISQHMDAIRKATSRCPDPFAFVSCYACELILYAYRGRNAHLARRFFTECLEILQTIGCDVEQEKVLQDCLASLDLGWDFRALTGLMRFFTDTGLSLEHKYWEGQNVMTRYMRIVKDAEQKDRGTIVEVLSALVEAFPDSINAEDFDRLTPSMTARLHGVWREWCEALQRNGKRIEDVVREEGSAWLLEDDWKETWREHEYPLFSWLKHSDSGSDLGDEDEASEWSVDTENEEDEIDEKAEVSDNKEDLLSDSTQGLCLDEDEEATDDLHDEEGTSSSSS